MNKVFLFGWSGFIGKEFLFKSNFDNIVKVGRNPESDLILDLSNLNLKQLSVVKKNDCFIFLSAISSPDFCEKNKKISYNSNVTNTLTLINFLLKKEVNVLFSSSDIVYGYTKFPVNENNKINPMSFYGEMKAIIENKFSNNEFFKVMRLSYVSSMNDKFSNFLISNRNNLDYIEIYDAFIRSIICIDDVIAFIHKFIEYKNKINPIVNLAGPAFISRVEYSKALNTNLILNLKFKITTPSPEFFISRPKQILMKSLYLENILKRKPYNPLEKINQIIKQ